MELSFLFHIKSVTKMYLSYLLHLNLYHVFTCFKLLSTGIRPPNSPHSHHSTGFQNGTSVPTPNLISLKPASLENAKISASLFLSHPALMSLENCSSVAKRQAKRKYFGCVSSWKEGESSCAKWIKALLSLFLRPEKNVLFGAVVHTWKNIRTQL